jgi:segregation and condensation protein A
MEVICAFLAVLELVKSTVIVVFQNKVFGDILLKAREAGESDEP